MIRLPAFSALFAAHLLLAACLATPPVAPPDRAARAFDVAAFFSGRTHGNGVLRVVMGGRRTIRVDSSGRIDPDGALTVDQSIREQGRPVRTRSWRIREVAPGRYAGSLSDAAGPVTGRAEGNRLHLAFRARGGLAVQQWLTLAPDGRTVRNVLVARKFGLPVAVLEETIRRAD